MRTIARAHQGSLAVTTAMTLAGLAAATLATAPAARAQACDGERVPCALGDTGPGGGTVFYDAGSPQPWGRYLEAAPADWAASLAPAPPESVKASARPGQVAVTWRAPKGSADRLRYQVRVTPGRASCQTDQRSCTVKGLTPGSEVSVQVVAINRSGEGMPSQPVQVRIPRRPPQGASPKPDPAYRSQGTQSGDLRRSWCQMRWPGNDAFLPTGTAIGSGRANTRIVTDACGPDSSAGTAARYRGQGLSDWHLPAKDELAALFAQRALIPGLSDVSQLEAPVLWSSSQGDFEANSSWAQGFQDGLQHNFVKGVDFRTRPIRAF